jgi:hypothetical protein
VDAGAAFRVGFVLAPDLASDRGDVARAGHQVARHRGDRVALGPGEVDVGRMRAVASAADSVIVMTKSVVTKPSSTRTKNLPYQRRSRRSSIAIEPPWPYGLSRATVR